jgi:hypothetical protein
MPWPYQLYDYGTREHDGSAKGQGWLGERLTPSGDVATELSFEFGPQRTAAPLMVPGLTEEEIRSLIAGDAPSDSTYDKAESHARMRLLTGKSPFAQPWESPGPWALHGLLAR